jgi:hypothetical protein
MEHEGSCMERGDPKEAMKNDVCRSAMMIRCRQGIRIRIHRMKGEACRSTMAGSVDIGIRNRGWETLMHGTLAIRWSRKGNQGAENISHIRGAIRGNTENAEQRERLHSWTEFIA